MTLRDHLEQAIREEGRALHPDAVEPIVNGELDPTARESVNALGETITAESRSVQSALAFYTVEGFFVALTPLGMLAVAFGMLQHLSGDHGPIPVGIDPAMLDPWKELAPFRELVCEPHEGHEHEALTAAEECRRALWHLARAYDAAMAERQE